MRQIDGDALLEELEKMRFPGAPYVDAGVEIAIGKVCEAPTIEAERKTGRWIDGHCSNCGCDIPAYIIEWKWQKDIDANYCPNCGVRMEG